MVRTVSSNKEVNSKLINLLTILLKMHKIMNETDYPTSDDFRFDREMALLNRRLEQLIEICQGDNLLPVGQEVCVPLKDCEFLLRLTAHSLDLLFDPAIPELVEGFCQVN